MCGVGLWQVLMVREAGARKRSGSDFLGERVVVDSRSFVDGVDPWWVVVRGVMMMGMSLPKDLPTFVGIVGGLEISEID